MKVNQGFTLVELLVAISILGIVLISIGAILPGLAKVNRISSQEQVAVLAARAYFEQVRAELKNDFEANLSGITVPGNNQNGLTCTPTVTSKNSTTVTSLKVSKTVTLACTQSGRKSNFTLTVANPALGKI